MLFDGGDTTRRNEFSFGLSPDVCLSLTAHAKMPGEAMVGEEVRLVDHRWSATRWSHTSG